MKTSKTLFAFCLVFLLTVVSVVAQSVNDQVEMADAMHANGKIYVVVTVLAVVFIGIVIFLISIDRKLSRLERKQKGESQ